jgi:hypothetical protein
MISSTNNEVITDFVIPPVPWEGWELDRRGDNSVLVKLFPDILIRNHITSSSFYMGQRVNDATVVTYKFPIKKNFMSLLIFYLLIRPDVFSKPFEPKPPKL